MRLKYTAVQGAFVGLLLASTALAPVQGWAQAVNAGEVSAAGAAALPGTIKAPSQKKIFHSATTTRVLNRQIMDAAGPVAGSAQILSYAPGVNVSGYGNSGSTK